ncbi:MAG: anti-sigma factor, partial [Acidobacteriota bacterium]|nr:anti-sigma factor [Acidobacteriota bacterium]
QPPAPQVRPVENAAELQRLRDRVTTLEHQVSQYQTLLDIERRRADRSTEIASLVTSPQLRIVPLRGTERTPDAEGRVLISGNSRMVFVASGMPAPPPNRTYQLWIIRSGQPAIASAGTFAPGTDRRAILQLADASLLRNVTAFAVTDEPVGGSAQPTGQKWLIGL